MALYATYPGTNQGALFGGGPSNSAQTRGVSVTAENGGLKIVTPYSATFVTELKSRVPATSRKWDNNQKAWYVTKENADILKEIIDRSYSCNVTMPTVIAADAPVFETTFQADYVANCRNDVSSVHSKGGWNAKIPEKVLREWFKQADQAAPATLYGLLGLDQKALPEEIKKAYKRAARQWHPDICKESNAREMFEAVKEAYDVLSDPLSRNKYNAGLMFEQMAKSGSRNRMNFQTVHSSFTPLLRCGMLKVRAKQELGILVVEEILSWDDITNEAGQIMVTSWADDSYQTLWV